MTSEASALASAPDTVREDDYRSFSAALEASARGRGFLAEYARRNRNADTETLLAALARLEATIRAEGTTLERLRNELRMLLIAIRLARPEIAAAQPPDKAAKLASLLDLLEARIDAMADKGTAEPAPAEETAPQTGERLALSVVPPSDEPELPIPSPAGAQPPAAIALVRNMSMPDVSFIATIPPPDAAPQAAQEVVPEVTQQVMPRVITPDVPQVKRQATPPPLSQDVTPDVKQAAPPAAQIAATPPTDALMAIMALSEEERIALFT